MSSPTADPPLVIQRSAPNAVIYDLSTPNQVTVTLPVGSTWSSGLHWHETHTEYLHVVRGVVKLRTGATGTEAVAHAGSEVRIDRGVWHEWSRVAADEGEEVVVIERTDPADGEKAVFFCNLNGVILDAQKGVQSWATELSVTLQLFTIFRALDNFPVFINAVEMATSRGMKVREGSFLHQADLILEWVVTHLILSVASLLASLFNIKPVQLKYTPKEEHDRWWARKAASGKPKAQ